MAKPFEFHGVDEEKAEATRRYNNGRSFGIILRAAAVALLGYLWFPTAAISLQTAGDWFLCNGAVTITNRSVIFVVVILLVALIFLLSRDSNYESNSSITEPDLYDQYTSHSAAAASVEKVEYYDSNKKIVPTFVAEVEKVVVEEETRDAVIPDVKGTFRRTKSEKTNKVSQEATEFRRTEPVKMVAMERLSSEEFRLKVERFIMEKKMSLVHENDVVQEPALVGAAAAGYGSC